MLSSAFLGVLDFPILRQGNSQERPSKNSVSRLTPCSSHSLLAGVDVQGERLSCVSSTAYPSAVPAIPWWRARVRAIDAEGGNAFFDYQVPAAVITLKTRLRPPHPLPQRPRTPRPAWTTASSRSSTATSSWTVSRLMQEPRSSRKVEEFFGVQSEDANGT